MWEASLRRLGLVSRGEEEDSKLVVALFAFLRDSGIGYEQFWFDWYGGALSAGRAERSPAANTYRGTAFAPLRELLTAYAPRPGLRLDHPYFARERPRTMLIDEMEALWAPIAADDDWSAFNTALGEIDEMRDAYRSGDAP
jgi:hypothetical protein